MSTTVVTRDKKSKRVSTPAPGWTEVDLENVQAAAKEPKKYADMKPAALKKLAKERGIEIDANEKDDAYLIKALEAQDASADDDDLG